MVSNHTDMLSIFSPRETQIKTTTRHYYTPIRMDQIKKQIWKYQVLFETTEQLELLHKI